MYHQIKYNERYRFTSVSQTDEKDIKNLNFCFDLVLIEK